jgi:hypothetical protein
MLENVQDIMLDILKRIQTDVADIKLRVETLEDLGKKHRRDSAAMLVMMRGTAAVFNARLLGVEVDVHRLKGQADSS